MYDRWPYACAYVRSWPRNVHDSTGHNSRYIGEERNRPCEEVSGWPSRNIWQKSLTRGEIRPISPRRGMNWGLIACKVTLNEAYGILARPDTNGRLCYWRRGSLARCMCQLMLRVLLCILYSEYIKELLTCTVNYKDWFALTNEKGE